MTKKYEVDVEDGYEDLYKTLWHALERAQHGKGAQRHGDGQPFNNQWIMRGTKRFGIGGILFQIGKKSEEVLNLESEVAKIEELLDIMVYAAAGIMYLEKV